MADLSPAEIMVDSLVPAQRLIRRIQAVQDGLEPFKCISIYPATKARITAFRDDLQCYIDELTAQREKAVALIRRISDPNAQVVIMYRYGLISSSCEKMGYPEICERMNYEHQTIYGYRKKGIEELDQFLEKGRKS